MAQSTTAAALALAVAVLLTACGSPQPPEATPSPTASRAPAEPDASAVPSTPATPAGTLDEPAVLATGLDAPWSIAFLPGGGALVSERDSATIVEVRADGTVTPIIEIAGVDGGDDDEGGLLGIAVHDGHLYWYATGGGENLVQRTTLTGAAGALTFGQPETVIEAIPAAGNHNGGRIAFGPDGKLYVTAGDAAVPSRAQDPASLAGKILRLEPDGAIPADNPFPGSPVYSLGHRNPQSLAWDDDGRLWATEFGQDTWDELNAIEAGANYGWPTVEGIGGDARFRDPVQQWSPAEASPSGMAFAAGSLWIANLRGESLRQVDFGDASASTVHWLDRFGRMRDVAVAPDGSLWALTNNTDGRGTPADGDDRILVFGP
ncbi:PQQ-dependent sugar dehydrogenase [Agrococcus beijingensis]|uniref:PQQ-dependent sugar dehydrogenase n=1 Tax=Agrococcus beijingensis TaxID=3068634 RepID=UPI002740FA9C|nr:PQQ-dependent sugar dehydrogenase [Agrococcus sp. REN33]